MDIFKSQLSLVVLASLVFLFSGCGGGGSNEGNNTSNPAPAPNSYTEPEVTNKPNPYTEPNTSYNQYSDTYDIASVMNGVWYGDSGSGTATNSGQTFNLMMNNMQIRIFNTQIIGNSGTTYISYRQYWDYDDSVSDYITRVTLYGDAEEARMIHTGNNVWQCTFLDGTIATITFLSEREAMVTQNGTTKVDNVTYSYSLRYTMSK